MKKWMSTLILIIIIYMPHLNASETSIDDLIQNLQEEQTSIGQTITMDVSQTVDGKQYVETVYITLLSDHTKVSGDFAIDALDITLPVTYVETLTNEQLISLSKLSIWNTKTLIHEYPTSIAHNIQSLPGTYWLRFDFGDLSITVNATVQAEEPLVIRGSTSSQARMIVTLQRISLVVIGLVGVASLVLLSRYFIVKKTINQSIQTFKNKKK